MMRVDAFEHVNGFRTDLIAGEEPELCVRLRAAGWKIRRLDAEMALHDATMFRFGQWWKRSVRAGYAFAEGAYLHGAPPERYWVAESRRAWVWGGWGLVLYPLQVVRLALRGGRSPRENWWRALFLVLGKFPEVVVGMKFLSHLLLGGLSRLIEYK